jgi:hypothetical protein
MKTVCELITPPDVERRPELPVLGALEAALEMTSLALCTHYPEILPPDWPLRSPRPPEPAAYMANLLLTLTQALRNATRAYRETIVRDLIESRPVEEDDRDEIPF